jgi:hypothetical protein
VIDKVRTLLEERAPSPAPGAPPAVLRSAEIYKTNSELYLKQLDSLRSTGHQLSAWSELFTALAGDPGR